MEETFSAQYIFVRGRQLEGSFPGDAQTGIWPITGERVARGWGNVREQDWPFDDSVWPPLEPPDVDRLAIKVPDFYYQRVRTLQECKSVMACRGMPVVASFNISREWYDAPNGRITGCRPDEVCIGSHVVLLHSYDDSRQEFSFQNSWGVGWGDKGHGYLSYAAFESSWVEGWCRDFVAQPMLENPNSGVQERHWGVQEFGGGILHCREFVGSKAGRIGWAFFVERDARVEVEELFILPAFRKRGYARMLVRLIANQARERGATLKAWVSHADTGGENILMIDKLASRLGLVRSASPFRWASYVLAQNTGPSDSIGAQASVPRAAQPSVRRKFPGVLIPSTGSYIHNHHSTTLRIPGGVTWRWARRRFV